MCRFFRGRAGSRIEKGLGGIDPDEREAVTMVASILRFDHGST
jgi:hypothetical protein